MDQILANKLHNSLKGEIIKGLKIVELINNGKSAAVFRAVDNINNSFAVKIFDNELIERVGFEVQEHRIHQELSLKDHNLINLVKIYDGGITILDNVKYFFVVMEYLKGINLKQFIESKNYDEYFIAKIIYTLISLTENLLAQDIVHRDIKPENIMIGSDDQIILMDLGVLKPIGQPGLSDQNEKTFVGTLRYAPPEFLTRTESDTKEGWRAVNLYQIGAVVHDLIMKKEIYGDIFPYSNIVISIKEDIPNVSSVGYSFKTQQLCRDMLTKDWRKRLNLCSQAILDEYFQYDFNNSDSVDAELDALLKSNMEHGEKYTHVMNLQRSKNEQDAKIVEQIGKLEILFDNCIKNLEIRHLFTTHSRSKSFLLKSDINAINKKGIKTIIYLLNGELSGGFSRPLYLVVKLESDEHSYGKVGLMGAFISNNINHNFVAIVKMLDNIVADFHGKLHNGQNYVPPRFHNVFTGTISDSKDFKDQMTVIIIKFIRICLERVVDEVRIDLQNRENLICNLPQIPQIKKTIIIDKI